MYIQNKYYGIIDDVCYNSDQSIGDFLAYKSTEYAAANKGGNTYAGIVKTIAQDFIALDKRLDNEKIKNELDFIFRLDKNYNNINEMCSIIINKMHKLNKVRDTFIFPMNAIDRILTNYINFYLKYMLCSNIIIDSAISDFGDLCDLLFQDADAQHTLSCLTHLIYYFLDDNFTSLKAVYEILATNETMLDNGKYFYIVPIVVNKIIAADYDYDALNNFISNLNTTCTVLEEDDASAAVAYSTFNGILEDYEVAHKCGYLEYYLYTTDSLETYQKVIILRLPNRKYKIVKN